jgi:FlaA1/EpsC-like NDP-sugar epimerase
MTIPEASQLIMQAAAMGKGGEIFVLDMGKPVKITYLAEQMIKLSGRIPGQDIRIIYTGLRPGEKLYEELFYENESQATTGHPKILLARHSETDWSTFSSKISELEMACSMFDEDKLRSLLEELVPVFTRETSGMSNVISMDKART